MKPTRAQLQRLRELLLDCGDNSCMFAAKKTGMRTNGGCSCLPRISEFSYQSRVARLLRALPALLDRHAELEALLRDARRDIHQHKCHCLDEGNGRTCERIDAALADGDAVPRFDGIEGAKFADVWSDADGKGPKKP